MHVCVTMPQWVNIVSMESHSGIQCLQNSPPPPPPPPPPRLCHGQWCGPYELTHWGRVTHICVSKRTIIGSDNGLPPGRRQAIIWTNAGILLIGPLGTYFSEILIGVQTFSFKKMHLKMSSAKCRPFCPGLNVLRPKWLIKLLASTPCSINLHNK